MTKRNWFRKNEPPATLLAIAFAGAGSHLTADALKAIAAEHAAMKREGQFLDSHEEYRWAVRLAVIAAFNEVAVHWRGRCAKCGQDAGPWANELKTICAVCAPLPVPSDEALFDAIVTVYPRARIRNDWLYALSDAQRRQAMDYLLVVAERNPRALAIPECLMAAQAMLGKSIDEAPEHSSDEEISHDANGAA